MVILLPDGTMQPQRKQQIGAISVRVITLFIPLISLLSLVLVLFGF